MIIKTELRTKRIVLGSVLLLTTNISIVDRIYFISPTSNFYRDSMNNSKMSCLSI